MSLEQTVNCNTTQESLGVSGCAFLGVPPSAAQLTIPPVNFSNLIFTSTGCDPVESWSANKANTFKLSELYTANKDTSCSFSIGRYVYDSPKRKVRLDYPQIGRFFIKIVPPNRYHALSKFSIARDTFTGVGWFQHRYALPYPQVTFHPEGTKGTLLIKCGTKDTLIQEYTTAPFSIEMPTEECDYEIALVNEDSPMIEFGTLIVMNQEQTEDIKLPLVSLKRNSIEFTFPEKNSKNKNSVVGVQVEDRICKNDHRCSYPLRPSYTVKAVTANMRFFKGIYDSTTQKWKVIR